MLINTFKEVKEKGVEIDEVKLIGLMGAEQGVAERTAKEYIRCAKAKFENGTD